ncbi:hypothetical protein SUDANB171_00750 [Streptomyces sp. enrichment culture]|uniref:hypothetical protein n=1 Tax=Streptomyces sp. enrichment culture TaxID=1795815 RepID=UPI003F560A67
MARTESGKQPLPEQQHTKTPAATAAPLPAAALHQLQRSAGNAAVARLVAQRYTPPVKPPPAQAPGLRRVNADIGAKRQKLSAHPAPTAESRAAQDAAVAPPDDKQAQAKTQQAEKMNAAEPGDFDKAAFITAVNQAVEAQAPKNLDEADNFSDSGNADRIKDEVDGQVTDGAESSAEDIATTTGEAPDTSTATDKEVTPLTADQPPGNPGAPHASDAVPERQPEGVTDFSEGQRDTEQQMADADVTEEQLARGNEPDFDNALSEKKQGEEETAAAPGQARAAENAEIQTAKSGAAAAGAQAMAGLTATRQETGAQVDSGKNETKSEDEKKREQVTAKLQKVFDDTKTDVEKTLVGLDDKVDTQFTNGEKRARDDFTADHERRMKAYKDKRYSGLRGKARWVKDKFAGLPDEANDLYQESRKLYVNKMQGVISDIADTIGRELGRAKTRIERGRTELQAEVEKLPADLRRFGEEAAADFSGQFDDLETTVDEKSEQLVQDLAQKYTEALDAIDEEIKALQEANKGLWDRIKDAVVGVIQTIIELTNALMGILAKAASAVSKIIKDPIGFLGNVVRFVGDGLNLFTANIEQHLKTGLVSWLLGTAVKTGLEIPAKFDAKGIVQLLASLLGLTWDTIRAKIVRKGVPDKAMATVEKTIPEAQALQREGPAGLTKDITGESGDLKKTILDDLKSYLIPTVIVAGIAWIVSLLTPASAFVRAVKGIIDIVTFIVTQAAQITDFMNAILDAVIAIADGAAAGVPKLIESALSTSIPVLLGFLAALLGIGSLANKVKSVFQKVSRPVGRAIDKIIDRIAKSAKRLLRAKGKNGSGNPVESRRSQDVKREARRILSARTRTPFTDESELQDTVSDVFLALRPRGLKSLRIVPISSDVERRQIVAKASPESSVGKAKVDGYEKKKREWISEIPESVSLRGWHLSREVTSVWWKSQLKPTEAWPSDSVLNDVSGEAVTYLRGSTVRDALADYFEPAKNGGVKRTAGPDAGSFQHFSLHGLNPNPKHSVREGFYEKLGESAVERLKAQASREIYQNEALCKKLDGLGYGSDSRFGRFFSLPTPDRELDERLKKAAGGRVIEFLKDMADVKSSRGLTYKDLLDLWDEKGVGENPHRKWLKDEFRNEMEGHHEWIPMNLMIAVMEMDMKQRTPRNSVGWIDLQHQFRSFTTDVIWEVRPSKGGSEIAGHEMDAHAGAFKSYEGNPIYNGRDGKWHDSLRGYFDEYIGGTANPTPVGFLRKMQSLLLSGKLMWDGSLANFDPEQGSMEVKAIRRRRKIEEGEIVEEEITHSMTLEELGSDQEQAFNRLKAKFDELITAFE